MQRLRFVVGADIISNYRICDVSRIMHRERERERGGGGGGSDSYHSVNPSKYGDITLRQRKICDDPLERLNVNVNGNHDFFYSFSSFR